MWSSLVAAALAWDPDAGRIPSFTEGATASASSAADMAGQIIDGDQQTHWQSASCFPTGWLSRAELNLLLGACAAGACSGTASGDLSAATDADGYTNLSVPLSGGQALLRVDFGPSMAEQLLIRGRFGDELVVYGLSGGARVELLRLDSSHSWTWQEAALDTSVWEALEIESTAAFLLTDVGLYLGPCLERATVDLGAPVELGWIRTRHWAGGSALSTVLLGPAEGPPRHVVAWRPIDGDDDALTELEVELPAAPTQAWRLSGRSAEGEAEALPLASGLAWRLALGAAPLLLTLEAEAEDSGAADGGGEDGAPDTASGDGEGGSAGGGLDSTAAGGEGGEAGAASGAKAPPAGCGCAAPVGTPGLWALAVIGLRRRR